MMSLPLSILQHMKLLEQLLAHGLHEISTYQSFPLVFIPSLDGRPYSAADSDPAGDQSQPAGRESNSMGTSPAPCKAFSVRCCSGGFSVKKPKSCKINSPSSSVITNR